MNSSKRASLFTVPTTSLRYDLEGVEQHLMVVRQQDRAGPLKQLLAGFSGDRRRTRRPAKLRISELRAARRMSRMTE